MKRIAIFASGRGSNAKRIIEHFQQHPTIDVVLIASNKSHAGVLDIARQHHIETLVFDKARLYKSRQLLDDLRTHQIDFIVLAGFLWLVPTYLIQAYPKRIINIHPALLPKYGGKGMYGMHVHQAVCKAKETETGITIHYVNEVYDDGEIIFQTTCSVTASDAPQDIAHKVQRLEHQHFPRVIERLLEAV